MRDTLLSPASLLFLRCRASSCHSGDCLNVAWLWDLFQADLRVFELGLVVGPLRVGVASFFQRGLSDVPFRGGDASGATRHGYRASLREGWEFLNVAWPSDLFDAVLHVISSCSALLFSCRVCVFAECGS